MSILSWLKSVTHAGTDTVAQPLQFAAGEEHFHGLDMKGALDAHMAWTRRVENHLKGRDDTQYEVAEVAADHLCTLGKWIHGEARQHFGGLEEYEELRRIHADFHLEVGRALNEVEHGAEKGELALKTVRYKSGQVQLALVRLYSVVHQGAAH